jgi:hypothetical protein
VLVVNDTGLVVVAVELDQYEEELVMATPEEVASVAEALVVT